MVRRGYVSYGDEFDDDDDMRARQQMLDWCQLMSLMTCTMRDELDDGWYGMCDRDDARARATQYDSVVNGARGAVGTASVSYVGCQRGR